MALYPYNLRYSEIAALDLPIPGALINHDDREQWRDYAKLTSPGRLLAKFGQALDEFHTAIDGADLSAEPDDRRITIYSKWEAAQIIAEAVTTRLGFALPRAQEDAFDSDIGMAVFFATKFLEETGSPQPGKWNERVKRHGDIHKAQPSLARFLDEIYNSHVIPPKTGPSAQGLQP